MQRPGSLTFANFVAAAENRSALTAVQSLADWLCSDRSALEMNPLFLHGRTGTGKSHLASALMQKVSRQAPHLIISRVSAADWPARETPCSPPWKGGHEGLQDGATVQPSPLHKGGLRGVALSRSEKTPCSPPWKGGHACSPPWKGGHACSPPWKGGHERLADGVAADHFLPSAEDCDLWVFEDVHLLNPGNLWGFENTFEDLRAHQVPMVFTAAVGPGHLQLPARWASRLAGGLVVGLAPLEVAGRRTLLQEKAQRRQLAVAPEILNWLADHLAGGGRQLEGALIRLEALSRSRKRALGIAEVAEHFQELVVNALPTVERIAEHVSGYFRVASRLVRSEKRARNVLLPRQVCMYLARKLTELSLEQIGAYFGGRDHSTVLHACRKVERRLQWDSFLSGAVRQLSSELR